MRLGVFLLVALLAGCTTPPTAPNATPTTNEASPSATQVPNQDSPTSSVTVTSQPANHTEGFTSWQAGDSWTTLGSWSQGANWTETLRVLGMTNITYNGTRQATLQVNLYTVYQDSAGWRIYTNQTEWLRPRDLAPMLVQSRSHAKQYSLQEHWENRTKLYDAPCARMHWPLAQNASWNVTCSGNATDSTGTKTFHEQWHMSVLAPQQVHVTAGTFTAFPVKALDPKGATSTTWYAATACGPIKETTGSGQDIIQKQLAFYTC